MLTEDEPERGSLKKNPTHQCPPTYIVRDL